jgi:hypothetical protein
MTTSATGSARGVRGRATSSLWIERIERGEAGPIAMGLHVRSLSSTIMRLSAILTLSVLLSYLGAAPVFRGGRPLTSSR